MWLPRDERYLLMVYHVCAPQPSVGRLTFSIDDLQRFFMKKHLRIPLVGPKMVIRLARLLHDKKEAPAQNHNKSPNYKEWLEAKQRIEAANSMLKERNLVEVRECGTGFYEIKMRLKGSDLGRKYSSWWKRSNLWYAEYIKNHWIWVIGSFVSGVIATLLAQLLLRVIV